MSRRRATALAVVCALVAATTARADDAAIQRKVEERLARAKVYQAADVRISVKDGAVEIDGLASRLDVALAAERAARKESKNVVSRIRVVPEVERKDAELRKDVEGQILRYPWYTVFDSIAAGVADGVVTLEGSVNQPWRKAEIEARVAQVAGLKGLVSRIAVQPVSPFDDQLRRQLVRRIYGDERFVQYASWAHPPIRIIVDQGKVTLTGYVGSTVEQQLLGHIARGTLAFAVDNQVKLESERKAEPAKQAPVSALTS